MTSFPQKINNNNKTQTAQYQQLHLQPQQQQPPPKQANGSIKASGLNISYAPSLVNSTSTAYSATIVTPTSSDCSEEIILAPSSTESSAIVTSMSSSSSSDNDCYYHARPYQPTAQQHNHLIINEKNNQFNQSYYQNERVIGKFSNMRQYGDYPNENDEQNEITPCLYHNSENSSTLSKNRNSNNHYLRSSAV